MVRFFLPLLLIAAALAPCHAVDVDFTDGVVSYGGNQDAGNAIVYNAGLVTVAGNAWKAAPLPAPYTITETTVIEVSVDVQTAGEIVGIGLVTELGNIDAGRTFQLAGSQTWGIQDYRLSDPLESVRITIPVGQYYTGQATHVALVGDDDARGQQHTQWSTIRVYDAPPSLPVFKADPDSALLVAHDAGADDPVLRAMINRIQATTGVALDDASGFVLDVDYASQIRSSISTVQRLIDRGQPGFFWSPVSTIGRDTLSGLADALEVAEDAGLATYDGAAAAGTVQCALQAMAAVYDASSSG